MQIKEKHSYRFRFYIGEETIDAKFCSNEWNVISQALDNGSQRVELIDGEPTFFTRENKIKGTKVECGEKEKVNFDKWELLEDAEYDTRRIGHGTYFPSGSSRHGANIKF